MSRNVFSGAPEKSPGPFTLRNLELRRLWMIPVPRHSLESPLQ